MKRLHRKRDAAALSSRLIRRPIQRMVWLFLLPTFAAFCIGFFVSVSERRVFCPSVSSS